SGTHLRQARVRQPYPPDHEGHRRRPLPPGSSLAPRKRRQAGVRHYWPMSVHERRRLPADLELLFGDGGDGRELSVELPSGTLVWPDPDYDRWRTHHRPSFWLSDAPVSAGLWTRLRREHPRSGLWP